MIHLTKMIFGRQTLSPQATRGVVTFTVIETVVLALWLVAAQRGQFPLSVAILLVGLGVEHYIATQIGKYDP
jgi:hypothetical protein